VTSGKWQVSGEGLGRWAGVDTRRLLACGVAAAGLGAVGILFGGVLWPGYDPLVQTVSQLVARDAPQRLELMAWFVVYNGWLLAFGVGLRRGAWRRPQPRMGTGAAGGEWRVAGQEGPADGAAQGEAWLRRGANRVVILGVLGLVLLALPVDPAGAERTVVGLGHGVVAAGMTAAAAEAALFCGLGWQAAGAARLGRWSLAAAGLMALFAALTFAALYANGPAGLAERLLIGSYLVWMGGLGRELGIRN